jgi:O-acetyl-ADP-ribose deacetylase (regulator of RNase III)
LGPSHPESTQATVDLVTIEIVVGDIATQTDMDAVVNAANAELRIGGGVAGALPRAAGPGLEEEGRALAPIRPGEPSSRRGIASRIGGSSTASGLSTGATSRRSSCSPRATPRPFAGQRRRK